MAPNTIGTVPVRPGFEELMQGRRLMKLAGGAQQAGAHGAAGFPSLAGKQHGVKARIELVQMACSIRMT